MTPGNLLSQIITIIVLFVLIVEGAYMFDRSEWFQKQVAPQHELVADMVDTVASFHPWVVDGVRGVDHSAHRVVKQVDEHAKPDDMPPPPPKD